MWPIHLSNCCFTFKTFANCLYLITEIKLTNDRKEFKIAVPPPSIICSRLINRLKAKLTFPFNKIHTDSTTYNKVYNLHTVASVAHSTTICRSTLTYTYISLCNEWSNQLWGLDFYKQYSTCDKQFHYVTCKTFPATTVVTYIELQPQILVHVYFALQCTKIAISSTSETCNCC